VKGFVRCLGLVTVLLLSRGARAQVTVGDNLSMNLNAAIIGGYTGNSGDNISSNHGFTLGGSGTLSGSYYNPNFLNFTVTPFYNQSRANSSYQSLTDSTGIDGLVNLFNGSHYPGYVSYQYTRNSTGTYGVIGGPNFTTVGNSQAFGIGWSALIPDLPTLSVSYSQGSGNGNVYGTNDEATSSTKTFQVHSTYRLAGWNLGAFYAHLNFHSQTPQFLLGEFGNNVSNSSDNLVGVNASHSLPWAGSVAINFSHSNFSGDYFTSTNQTSGNTTFSTNLESAVVTFHPDRKLTLFADENYTDNLNGYLYQNLINGGNVPLIQTNSSSNSISLNAGATYNFTRDLYGQAQVTYFDQSYLGQSYSGSYLSGTLGYRKRLLDTFTFSATVFDSTNKFVNNALGFSVDANAFRQYGWWLFTGNLSYAQNVQTQLVTIQDSYYSYSVNVHRRFTRDRQWTAAYGGNHSGLSYQPGSVSYSNNFSTSLALGILAMQGSYTTAHGQSLLTSTGIQPIPPTPGLPQEGLIVYNGKSYGGGITLTPIPRLSINGTYTHAMSDTLGSTIPSHNHTEIIFSQLQYRLRQLNVLAGFTKFTQGISAAGTPPGSEYSYFIGVSRWINFF
jgi:hypothetical protein